MKQSDVKPAFLGKVGARPDRAQALRCGRTARRWRGLVSRRARVDAAAVLAHAAFLSPDTIPHVYDGFCEGWTGEPIGAPALATESMASLSTPDGLWDEYWAIAEDAIAGKLDAIQITARTAELGGTLGESYLSRTAKAAKAYPGVTGIAEDPLPNRIELGTLAACPQGSLGRTFHDLIVDNTFDLEVLDRDEIGLSALPTPLDYLNTRILQSHDLWHIVAGYETTALHEIALSAFQMAQFGHAYSAQFLAVMAAVGAITPSIGYPVLMTTIVSAYVHGRRSPPLITIDWESEWGQPTEAIRSKYGIEPYQRPYPADLIEQRLSA
ncbi:MAG: Coq4 family protein [Pseudomonadota bacterium]